MVTDYGFLRVSTGSQDAQTQERDILKAFPDAIIVRPDTKAASASKGEHLDALDAVIAKLRKGDRVIVTDSSRLDRRDNLTSQIQTMLAIRGAGAGIVSLASGEETFAQGDDLGSWITTIVKQSANADKSKTVKLQTWRGISQVMANKMLHGAIPSLWATKGERYGKQAYCADPEAVRDVYARVAAGESLSSVGRSHNLYVSSIKALIRFEANITGIIQCSYTYNGNGEPETFTWPHKVEAVVSPDVWWAANKTLDALEAGEIARRGGRPVAQPQAWVTGVLECPLCGGALYLKTGETRKGNGRMRTPTLRCHGEKKNRRACGEFKPIDAQPVINAIDRFFAGETASVLAYQRISGNQHELDAMEAELAKLQGALSGLTDRTQRREAVGRIEALEDQIDAFTVILGDYDYTETGQTIAGMWETSDDERRRAMVRAVKETGGIGLIERDGQWVIRIIRAMPGNQGEIVNLGGGLCYRRTMPSVFDMIDEMETEA